MYRTCIILLGAVRVLLLKETMNYVKINGCISSSFSGFVHVINKSFLMEKCTDPP